MRSTFFTQFDCAMPHTLAIGSPYALECMMFGFIVRRDQRLMRRLNRCPAPRWIRVWMLAATRAGDGWLWYAMALMILALGGENRFRALAAAILAAGSGILLFRAVKK